VYRKSDFAITVMKAAEDGLEDRRKPTIQLDEEQAIAVRKVNKTAYLALQDDQLVPERGIGKPVPTFPEHALMT
jgi:hypothetical protein